MKSVVNRFMAADRTEQENQLLHDLVSRYSPSGHERPATEFLCEVFRRWGWNARIDEVGNVVGEIGDGSPAICFLGHVDTVAGEIPLRLDGGRLFGRGTVDAKGPLAAAACAAARLPQKLSKKIVILGAVGEESPGSPGASHIVGRLRPDFAIIGEPSRWDRLTIGYKGTLHFQYTLGGPRAHAAAEMPSVGTSAVRFLAEVIRAQNNPPECEVSPFHSLTANVRAIHTHIEEFAETVTASVDMRLPPTTDPDDLERRIRQLAGDATIDVVEKLPAVLSNKNNRLVRAFLRAIRRQGGRPRFVLKTGTSDMNLVAPVWSCPIVAYGPGDSKLDHTPGEHIHLDEYQHAIAVLETTFQEL